MTNTRSEPSRTRAIRSASSSAARCPTSGSPPVPSPWVTPSPIRSRWGAADSRSACASVLQTMKSTPGVFARSMWSTALLPPPPTPITRMVRVSGRRDRPRNTSAAMSPMATMPPPTTRGALWARTSIPGVYRRVAHLPPAFRPVAYRSLLAGSIDDRLPDFGPCTDMSATLRHVAASLMAWTVNVEPIKVERWSAPGFTYRLTVDTWTRTTRRSGS